MARNDTHGQISIYIDATRIIVYRENLLRYKILKTFKREKLIEAFYYFKKEEKKHNDYKKKRLYQTF